MRFAWPRPDAPRDWTCHDNAQWAARKAVAIFEDDRMLLSTAANLVGVTISVPPADALRLAAAINAKFGKGGD